MDAQLTTTERVAILEFVLNRKLAARIRTAIQRRPAKTDAILSGAFDHPVEELCIARDFFLQAKGIGPIERHATRLIWRPRLLSQLRQVQNENEIGRALLSSYTKVRPPFADGELPLWNEIADAIFEAVCSSAEYVLYYADTVPNEIRREWSGFLPSTMPDASRNRYARACLAPTYGNLNKQSRLITQNLEAAWFALKASWDCIPPAQQRSSMRQVKEIVSQLFHSLFADPQALTAFLREWKPWSMESAITPGAATVEETNVPDTEMNNDYKEWLKETSLKLLAALTSAPDSTMRADAGQDDIGSKQSKQLFDAWQYEQLKLQTIRKFGPSTVRNAILNR